MTRRPFRSLLIVALITAGLWLLLSANGSNPEPGSSNASRQDEPPHAVILMYHRFGEDRYPATSIRVEQFEAHLAYLQDNDFNVLPLPTVVEHLQADKPLPPRTVAITVDDAYRSALKIARPRLAEAGMPWTLFVSTDQPDRQLGDFMSWEQLRELHANPEITIGHHSAAHHHMPDHPQNANRADLEHASARFRAELGESPDLLAYPFGEYSGETLEVVRELGFRAAFGQHSGVAHAGAPMLQLPRFAMNENWGRQERFEQRVNTGPLPVTDVRPEDVLVVTDNPPTLRFTIAADQIAASSVNCFASGGLETDTRRDGRRLTVTVSGAFEPGRARINCTAPMEDGSFRWYGRQFVVREPADDGHVPRSDPGAGTPHTD